MIRKWVDKWKQKRREKRVLDQCGCYIKCLICREIQQDNAICKELDNFRYEYTCGKCGNVAVALYSVFPLPVWESDVIQTAPILSKDRETP